MFRRSVPILLAFAIAATSPIASSATPDPSPLAECRLNFATAKARLKAMKPTGTVNKSGDDIVWTVTSYDPSAFRPLNFKATAFEHELWEEEDGQIQTLITTVDAPLGPVQAAMLASRRLNQCLQPFARPTPNQCMVAVSNPATGMPGIDIKEKYGKAQLHCRYRLDT